VSMMEVYDGWVTYRCRIEERTKRGKTKYRYVILRRLVREDVYATSRWNSNKDKVIARAKGRMNALDNSSKYRHEYL